MEQNRGFTFAIGLVALVLGVVLGLALCGSKGVRVATIGRDFRAGQPIYRDYYYQSGFRASAYDSFRRDENVYYEYREIPQTITFRSTDCTNPGIIDRYMREFTSAQFQDFANFCAGAGYPLG